MPPSSRGAKSVVAEVLARWAQRWLRQPLALVAKNPVALVLLLRVVEELIRRAATAWRFRLGRLQLQSLTDEIDGVIVQGCLLSTEHFLSMGRVEKRTLFARPLVDVLCGNEYLRWKLLQAAKLCRTRSSNCLVTRWLPPDERYHVLQASLNQASSMFGPNFVHFNALDGESTDHFKSTWYCITVMTPVKRARLPCMSRVQDEVVWQRQRSYSMAGDFRMSTSDEQRSQRGTLRIVLVNESELRRIADGKLNPPGWGFFNSRHRDRYRMLQDFSDNFHAQLVRTPADSRSASSKNPFTSERAMPGNMAKPDGGLFKRVHSQPQISLQEAPSKPVRGELRQAAKVPGLDLASRRNKWYSEGGDEGPAAGAAAAGAEEGAVGEDNCFLRVHVPHYVGRLPGECRTPEARRGALETARMDRRGSFDHVTTREGGLDAMTAIPSELPWPATPSFGE